MKASLTIKEQKEFYNKRWEKLQFINRLKLSRCIAILEAIAATRLIKPKIIDLGCGAGWLAAIVGLFGPTVGVDLSESAIKEASKKYSYVQFIAENILEWDYPQANFDIVISHEVIEHISNFKDQERYLEIASGLLCDGGYLILTTPNADLINTLPQEIRNSLLSQPIENVITVKKLRSMLSDRFEIIDLKTIVPFHKSVGVNKIMNWQVIRSIMAKMQMEMIFDKIWLKLGYGLHTFVVARKILR